MLKDAFLILGGAFASLWLLTVSSIFQGSLYSLAILVRLLVMTIGLSLGITVICYCVVLYDKRKRC